MTDRLIIRRIIISEVCRYSGIRLRDDAMTIEGTDEHGLPVSPWEAQEESELMHAAVGTPARPEAAPYRALEIK